MLPFTSCIVGSGQRKCIMHTSLTMTVSTMNCQRGNSYKNDHFECYLPTQDMPSCVTKNQLDADTNILQGKQPQRFRLCGRFSTLRKRRKKKSSPRNLQDDLALLDDTYNGSTQTMLEHISLWPFNAFSLDRATGGRPLPAVCFHLFHYYGLLAHFQLDPVKVFKFFNLVEDGYRSSNPYHNAIHATDVTQAMHCFLLEEKMRSNLTPLEIVGSLIAAMTHDLDHPGVNQPFLVATSNHLASLYKNASVLENHHWRSAMGCLLESGMMDALDRSSFLELQDQIKSLILATDIARQQEFLVAFQEHLKSDSLDMKRNDHRHFMLQIALKCADISNPCRPWEISKAWSVQVTEEFYRQGDLERNLGLSVTAPCDRFKSSMSKIQIGFFRFIAAPLFEEWHRFHDTGLSGSMLSYLRSNERKWEAILNHEECGNTHLAKALFESNIGASFNNLGANMQEPSLPMEYHVSQNDPTAPGGNSPDFADLETSKSMDHASRKSVFRDEELAKVSAESHLGHPFNQGATSALSDERENLYLGNSCADFSEGAYDQCKTPKRQQGQDCTVLLLKKEKKAKKIFHKHLKGFLTAPTKQQMPLPGGKKSTTALNSSKPDGSKLMARRGSAPTTYQPHAQLDITRLKRTCNLMNLSRNNTIRISKYSDPNGCSLRRRGSLPYDIGRRFSTSEWSMGSKLPSETTDSDMRRDSASPSLHSNMNISRCKAPVAERFVGKDADITIGANVLGFTRDCVNSFLLRDSRTRSFRRRRSGGPELFTPILWRSPIAQVTRPPQSVRINTVFSSQDISNQSVGELCTGEMGDRPFPGRRGSGPMELLAEMWIHRGSRSERSSIDSDDQFLKSHFNESCYNSISSDGLHCAGIEDLHLLPDYVTARRRSSCPFALPSVLGSTPCLAIR